MILGMIQESISRTCYAGGGTTIVGEAMRVPSVNGKRRKVHPDAMQICHPVRPTGQGGVKCTPSIGHFLGHVKDGPVTDVAQVQMFEELSPL